MVNYPYDAHANQSDHSPSLAPDDDMLRMISTVYATNHPTMANYSQFPCVWWPWLVPSLLLAVLLWAWWLTHVFVGG